MTQEQGGCAACVLMQAVRLWCCIGRQLKASPPAEQRCLAAGVEHPFSVLPRLWPVGGGASPPAAGHGRCSPVMYHVACRSGSTKILCPSLGQAMSRWGGSACSCLPMPAHVHATAAAPSDAERAPLAEHPSPTLQKGS